MRLREVHYRPLEYAVYVGTGGVFKNRGIRSYHTSGGANWNGSSAGLGNILVQALAIDPANPSIVYAGTLGGGVFKSTNGGANWAEFNAGLTNTEVRALAIDPTNPSILYAGTDGDGVFKSTDSGAN